MRRDLNPWQGSPSEASLSNSSSIIAFAGPPGCGKTTVMTALARLRPDASLVFMDHFPAPSDMSIGVMRDWLRGGGDFARLEAPGLAEALGELKAGRPIVEPLSHRRVEAAPLILLEMPLGRANPAIAPHIDYLVWIDTPPDVALARNVLAWETMGGAPGPWLRTYMEQYISVTRDVLNMQRASIMMDADLVLDGVGTPEDLAARVIEAAGPSAGAGRP